MKEEEGEKLRIYTDLEIKQTKNISLKRYFNSLSRNIPEDWKKLRPFSYSDNDSFKIFEDVICIRTPKFMDLIINESFYSDIIIGLSSSSINIIKIKINPEIKIEKSIQQIGYIMTLFCENILKPNKYYNSFNHQFTFGGPTDENLYKTDIRDERLIRLFSKKENKVFTLAKSNEVKLKTGTVSFSSPNNTSLSLSIMKKSYKRALSLYKKLKLDKVNGNFQIELKNKSILFDYFEEIISSLIFSYVSVETMTNAAIPADYQYENFNERGIKEIWSKENIERWMSTSDKISKILPKVLNSEEITKETFWSNFKDLEKLRNQIIHQKTIEKGTKLDSEVYESLLKPSVFINIKSSLSVIEYFYKLDNTQPYFPLGMGIAKVKVNEIESMEKHFVRI